MAQRNAAMFVIAREARGLTQTEVARRVGIAQGAVSKIENGLQQASDVITDAYVRELRFPRSFFELQLEARTLPPHFWRKKARVTPSQGRCVEARTNILRMQLRTLLRSADVPTNTIPSFDRKSFQGTAADAARIVREKWMLARGPIPNLTTMLEDRGVVIVPFDFETDDIDGMSMFDPADSLPPLILVNPRAPGDRQRWSLAHELGHLVLHTDPNYAHSTETEDEADAFASEFMMPMADIRGHLREVTLERLATLKLTWKMSIGSLLRRARDLKLVSQWRYTSLWKELSYRGWRLHEPNPIERESATMIGEVISFHKNDLGYTEAQLESALHMFAPEIRVRFMGGGQGGLVRVK
jgi:Zn-dependent peptidase ImmA (M78 family)/transcriptional regulator with XRE-family HTH domain